MFSLKTNFLNFIKKPNVVKNVNYNKFVFYFLFGLKSQFSKFKMNINTNCLILAQYPGAETKGVGGLLAQYPKNFEVLCFTNGSKMIPNTAPIDSARIKKQQFFEVMKEIRVKGYKIFDIDNKTLKDHQSTFRKIDISEADYIFVPNVYDNNIDTIILLKYFKQLLKEKEHKKSLKILMYESDFPLCTLDYYVDISSIIHTKKNMLLKYYPEEKYGNLANRLIGLNSFRGGQHDCEYSEAFMMLGVNEFLEIPMI